MTSIVRAEGGPCAGKRVEVRDGETRKLLFVPDEPPSDPDAILLERIPDGACGWLENYIVTRVAGEPPRVRWAGGPPPPF